jgi:nitroreductase
MNPNTPENRSLFKGIRSLHALLKVETMDAIECIRNRKSIRKFLPDPVPRELLTEVLETAKWSPSYKDSQPWGVLVLSGAKKEALSQMLLNKLENGEQPTPDLEAPRSWPTAEQARIDQLIRARQLATGVDLNAPENVRKSKKANFRFYNAPHAVYLLQDASLSDWSLFDIGLFAQSLMLAAHAKGLGTVPQAYATDYAREVKEFLGIPEGKRLVLGISLGYPDLDSPVNATRTERMDLDQLVTWME